VAAARSVAVRNRARPSPFEWPVPTRAPTVLGPGARRRHGDTAGTRALCDVLLLHRHHHADHVVCGIRAALSIDSVDPGVVAVETRRAIEHLAPEPAAGPVERVPDLSIYDQLLTIEPNPEGPPP